MIQALGTRYVRYFNRRYGRTGTLWEGRFKSTPIDSDEYYLACSRYIELNPVRAGMVSKPGEYAWSSFRRNALGEPDVLISSHLVFDALGSTEERRRLAYRDLFDSCLEPARVDAIRRATAKGAVLGSESFRERLEATLGRRLI